MTTRIRAVAAVRLSAYAADDNTTSPPRQREADQMVADAMNLDIVGWAEDLNVSASKVSPFDRPELGMWLRRPTEFDVLIFWRLDRAVRSMADMAELGRWAKQHKKRLIFAEGPSGGIFELDMSSPFSELIMMLLAFAAQMEAQAIQERVTGARAALRGMTRWPGGMPPYGYMLVPNPNGKGYLLAHDPISAGALINMTTWVLNGVSLAEIARRLTDDPTTPAPRDHARRRKGRAETGAIWHDTTVRHVLTSQAVLGYLLHKGKPIRDAEGNPRLVGPAILDRATYNAVVAEVESRSPEDRAIKRKDSKALLLGVVHCGVCQGRMYLDPPAKDRPSGSARYTCKGKSRGGHCTSKPSMRQDWVEDYAEQEFLRLMDRTLEYTIVQHGGYDPGPELAEVRQELKDHMADRELFRSETGKREWRDRLMALETRAAKLESEPVIPACEEAVPTGRTHGDTWRKTKDPVARRMQLQDVGARVQVFPGPAGGDTSKRDDSRLSFELGWTADPAAKELEAIAWEESL